MEGVGLKDDSELLLLGLSGSQQIRNELTVSTDPKKAIMDFQESNSILLPSLRPALPFLDLHSVPRLSFHTSTMEELRDKLIKRIRAISASGGEEDQQILVELLKRSFHGVNHEVFRPVVLCVLEHLPVIHDEYLSEILKDEQLFRDVSVPVKRQIWQDKLDLFADSMSPVIADFIREKEQALFDHRHPTSTFLQPPPRTRRQSPTVQAMVDMIGHNVKLYDMFTGLLRRMFLCSRSHLYCTLWVEVLMAVHDREYNDVCSAEPCHKFAWCVDACVREQAINPSRMRELQSFLDGVRPGQEQVLGDLAMVICDPFAMNTVLMSIMKIFKHCISTESLPRDNTELQPLLRIVGLGLDAWKMVESGVCKEPSLDGQLLTKYIPTVLSMMVDDQQRAVSGRSSGGAIGHDGLPSDVYAAFIKSNPLASVMAMHYVLQAARHGDREVVVEILPTLIHCENDRAYDDVFLHDLTTNLIQFRETFSCQQFYAAVFDDFYLPGSSSDNMKRHILRLVWHVHPYLPEDKLLTVMEAVQRDSDSASDIPSVVKSLQERIRAHVPSVVQCGDTTGRLILGVPTPLPL